MLLNPSIAKREFPTIGKETGCLVGKNLMFKRNVLPPSARTGPFSRCAFIRFPVSPVGQNFTADSLVRNVSLYVRMRNHFDPKGALARAEMYYAEHPGSPSAMCRPKLSVRSGTWIALLGQSIQDGITGFGSTVERALHAFDVQYLDTLRKASLGRKPLVSVR